MASLAVAVCVLTAVAAVTSWRAGWGQGRQVTVAVARAVLQLAAVGAVIATVFATPALAPLYLGVLLSVASWTSSRRLPRTAGVLRAAALAIGAGAAVTGLVVLVSGALPLSTRSFVPFLAQIIGGAMTATTLTGSRFADEVRTRVRARRSHPPERAAVQDGPGRAGATWTPVTGTPAWLSRPTWFFAQARTVAVSRTAVRGPRLVVGRRMWSTPAPPPAVL